MLQTIRDHLTGWVAIVLFVVIGLAFAVWGIDLRFTGSNAVASVNGEEIPVEQIRRAYRTQLSQYQQRLGEVPEPLQEQVREQVLEQLVRDELLAQHTADLGYRVGDDAVTRALAEIDAFRQDGRFSVDLYRTRLSLLGLSHEYFKEQLRRSLRVSQLQQAVTGSAFTTPTEMERRTRLEREERRFDYALLPAAGLRDAVELDEAEVVEYYEANQAQFYSPETVDVSYLELSLDQLAADVLLEEEELRDFYRQQVDAGLLQAPPERRARHILVTVDGETDDEAARAEAEELLARIEAGEDFAAVATESSDDPGSAPQGGDLGWAGRTTYVDAFAEALFSMEVDEVRGPIRTEFGYHLIRLEGVRGGEAQPFEEARADLEEELKRTRAEDDFYDLSELLADLTFENPDSLQPAADELGLQIRSAEGVSASGGIGIAANPDVLDALFSSRVLEDRENSNLIELDAERRVVVRVDAYAPAEQQPLEEVRERIEALLRDRAARELARERGESLASRVREGEDFATAAGEAGASYSEEQQLTRTGGAAVSPDLLQAVFRAPRPAAGAAVVDVLALPNGDHAVFRLSEVQAGEVDTMLPTQVLTNQLAVGDITALIAGLRSEARVTKRPELLQ